MLLVLVPEEEIWPGTNRGKTKVNTQGKTSASQGRALEIAPSFTALRKPPDTRVLDI